MIINDDLIHGVLVMVSFISGIVSAAGTWVLSSYVVKASEGASIAAVVIAFVLAIIFTSCALKVISACVTALYVCYAEDPAALANTKPQVYNKLTNSFLEAYQSKVVMFR
jgi:Mg2+/Co2+ transporter CorB